MRKYCLLLIVLPVLLLACNGNRNKVDISKINLEVNIHRFDKDLFAIPPDTIDIKKALPGLREKYGSFFNLYNNNIIHIGNSYSEMYPFFLQKFLNSEAVHVGWQNVKTVFADDTELNQQLTNAFKHYKYYFPEKYVPQIYAYISGFGESIALADSLIGISLEKYLGADFSIYDMLGISRYLSRRMYKEKIPSDCMRAWAIGEYPFMDESGNTLISKMVYEGKLLYFTKQMLPADADTTLFGFTNNQLKWCEDNAKNMWAYLIEQKLLFNTDRFMIIKMTEEAPYTSGFPPESPGKACNWIGYHIVEEYMNRHKNITLNDLMSNNNHQKIFEDAKYKP